MELINVFGGKGFVGSHFVKSRPDSIVNDRNDYAVYSSNILYFISTNTNYNILTNPFIDIDTNLTTLMKVLNNITDRENTTFNFISSWFVYGDTDLPAKETSQCNPKGFYSVTKRTAEQLLISYCETFNIKYRILRLANVIGTGDKNVSTKKNAISYLIQRIHKNEPIQLYDGGELYRDIISADDCIRAINLVLEKGDVNTIYNIGNGTPTTLYEIVSKTKTYLNSTSSVTSIPTPKFHQIVQVKSMYMDTTKLNALGYMPYKTLENMIDDLTINS